MEYDPVDQSSGGVVDDSLSIVDEMVAVFLRHPIVVVSAQQNRSGTRDWLHQALGVALDRICARPEPQDREGGTADAGVGQNDRETRTQGDSDLIGAPDPDMEMAAGAPIGEEDREGIATMVAYLQRDDLGVDLAVAIQGLPDWQRWLLRAVRDGEKARPIKLAYDTLSQQHPDRFPSGKLQRGVYMALQSVWTSLWQVVGRERPVFEGSSAIEGIGEYLREHEVRIDPLQGNERLVDYLTAHGGGRGSLNVQRVNLIIRNGLDDRERWLVGAAIYVHRRPESMRSICRWYGEKFVVGIPTPSRIYSYLWQIWVRKFGFARSGADAVVVSWLADMFSRFPDLQRPTEFETWLSERRPAASQQGADVTSGS